MKLFHFFALITLTLTSSALAQATDYTREIDALLPNMGSENPAEQKDPQQKLQDLVLVASRPGAETERLALAKALADKLGASTPKLARVWMLRQLERIGRAEAVAAIAEALKDTDPLVRDSARRALAANPAPEAGQVLIAALAAATDAPWRIALINALGYRADSAAVAALLKPAADDNDDIRSAALIALATIGDKSAADALAAAQGKGSAPAQRIAVDSYLRLADRLTAKGDQTTALAIYRKLLGSADPIKCAAIIGVGRAGSTEDLPVIFTALADQDAKVWGAALEALALMNAKEVTASIADKTKTSSGQLKALLIRALAARNDKSVMGIFAAAATDADQAVRVEALKALGTLGDAAAVPVLLKAALGAGPTQETARASLQTLKGADVDAALVAALNSTDTASEVMRTLAARRSVSATDAILKMAQGSDAAVRVEALKALAELADAKAIGQLVTILTAAAGNQERDEAAKALAAVARRGSVDNSAQPVLAALAQAQGQTRLTLLAVAGRIGGNNALAAVTAAVKDNDPAVRDAAVRALADWPDMTAVDDLLKLAADPATSETHHVVALRGGLRLAGQRDNQNQAQRMNIFAAVLKIARRTDEKRQALGGLGDFRDQNAIALVQPYLDTDLKEEAAAAAVKIARANNNPRPQLKPIMQKVLEISKNNNTRRDAQDVINKIDQRGR
jgi:HEAT repeat protein